jgi:hypothetical protein
MKIKVMREVEIEPATLRMSVAVRYGTEDIPEDFPGRIGDVWHAEIDVKTGRIKGWPPGRAGEVHMKVCDQGSYFLHGQMGEILGQIEDDYVPPCIPGKYGDYVEFNIDGDGLIEDWSGHFTADNVSESFFPRD